MAELLALYEAILKAATDDKIGQHLANLLTDANDLAAATKAVIEQAKARAGV